MGDGAPEMVLPDAIDCPCARRADELAAERPARARARAQPTRRSTARRCPPGSQPAALVMFAEKVRPDAAETLAYFPTRV